MFLSRYVFHTVFPNILLLLLSLQTVFSCGFSDLFLTDLQMTKSVLLLR